MLQEENDEPGASARRVSVVARSEGVAYPSNVHFNFAIADKRGNTDVLTSPPGLSRPL